MSKVSVIIAIYNVEQYLSGCLDSVLNQTYPDLEIIAVNDGSIDNSLAIARGYAEKDSRLLVIDKANGGLSDARNVGMEVATGKYLAFLDGDDTYDLCFINKMIVAMQEEDVDLVCCNYSYCWEDGRSREKNFLSSLPPVLTGKDAVSAFLRQEIIGSVTIKLFHKEICKQYGIRFPMGQNWEDITFTMEYLVCISKVAIIKEPLYNYLQSEISITRKKDSTAIIDIMTASRGCIQIVDRLYSGEFYQEKKALLTRSFICLLVYSFKCKDQTVFGELRKAIKEESKEIGLALLNLQERLLIILFKIHYKLSRFVFIRIYKHNQI